ncbi:MAG: MBL fold metallo-hydrolase, partial [Nitrospirota bacterium]
MNITIHRGSHEIGGSCVELVTKNSRILIDAGMPLKKSEEHSEDVVPRSLQESLTISDPPIAGLLISHAHLDHYGLISRLPDSIPVYSGHAAAALMKLSISLSKDSPLWRDPGYFLEFRASRPLRRDYQSDVSIASSFFHIASTRLSAVSA